YQEGALGVLLVGDPRIKFSYLPRFESTTIPVLVVATSIAEELLVPSGRKLADVRAAVTARRQDPTRPPTAFDVPTALRMAVSLTPVTTIDAFNVVGLLRGS